jgi:glycosyltransferase involved in cell wall biosynthesis
MKIAFLTTRMEKPSARYRFLQYVPYLEGEGLTINLMTIPSTYSNRQSFFKTLSDYDVVFLQKKLFGLIDWRALRRRAKRIIFDFDDAVMYKDSKSMKAESSSRLRRFERVVKGSDMVIAGNKYLEEWASRYSDNVMVIPTSIDMNVYCDKTSAQKYDVVTLGWIGSASTLIYLEKIRDVLDVISDKYPNVRLKIIADKFLDESMMPLVKKEWRAEDEMEDLLSLDIGLMPLTDDPWSRGKCGFKLLQYMGTGLCSVASPIGVNTEIISHGINGLLASTDEEWVSCLSRLIEDVNLRAALGRDARKTVIESYSTEVNAAKLLNVLKEVSSQ